MDVGAAIKQQMLNVLIDAIGRTGASPTADGTPAVSPLSPASPLGSRPGGLAQQALQTALSQIPAGAQVSARVVEWTPAGEAVLDIGHNLVTAQISGKMLPPEARLPGATLLLRVEVAGEIPRFSLVQVAPTLNPGRPSPAEPALSAGAPAASTGSTRGEPAPDAARTILAGALRGATAGVSDGLKDLAPTLVRSRSETPALSTVMQATTTAAATRQGSAAPLFAELAQLIDQPGPSLPPAALATARILVDSRLDGERPIAPEGLKEAIQRAAVPAEALVARGEPNIPDVKTLIVALRSLLALADRQPNAGLAPDAEPPHRDGAPAAVRPALPRLEIDADAGHVATILTREADQAVERSRLHQLASLPETRPGDQTRQHLSFDLPLALGQQTAIAGFRIDREKRQSKAANSGAIDSWGVRFAIDADGLGPVHAHLRLTGSAVSVSLWAEDRTTRQRFLDALPTLEAALAENALDIGELAILGGRPADPKPQAGLFLNRSS